MSYMDTSRFNSSATVVLFRRYATVSSSSSMYSCFPLIRSLIIKFSSEQFLATLANPVFVVAFFHDRDQVWHVAILKKKNHGGK